MDLIELFRPVYEDNKLAVILLAGAFVVSIALKNALKYGLMFALTLGAALLLLN
jgi:hypothetical protein